MSMGLNRPPWRSRREMREDFMRGFRLPNGYSLSIFIA